MPCSGPLFVMLYSHLHAFVAAKRGGKGLSGHVCRSINLMGAWGRRDGRVNRGSGQRTCTNARAIRVPRWDWAPVTRREHFVGLLADVEVVAFTGTAFCLHQHLLMIFGAGSPPKA